MSNDNPVVSNRGAALAAAMHPPLAALAGDPQRAVLPASIVAATVPIARDASLTGIARADDSVDAMSFAREAALLTPATPAQPLIEPLHSFTAYLDTHIWRPDVVGPPIRVPGALPRRVDHRAWQTDLVQSQGSRGTCWAFAGTAALEAAYARQGIRVKLSEHYLFHMSKAHENQRAGPGIHSLIGFQGSSDVVHHLKYWNLPRYENAPYIDQPALQILADSIPGTNGALKNAGAGTLEQDDWFEFDLRNIPLMARWFAQYGVADFGLLENYSLDDLKKTLAAGYDVVINVPGHVMLAYGYDDDLGVLLIKNSQSLPGFETMKYTGDPRFSLVTSQAYYIKSVKPVQTQWAAMWMGRWETDHDGWRGRLVIRRFLDVQSDKGVPPPNAPIALGTWYGFDGTVKPVVGGFVDGGRGMHCRIGDQPFELYLHSRDPYRAAGRCSWNNSWFGVVMSRGTAVGAGAVFDRSETIGLWDTEHDGWQGQMRVGVDPSYTQAADGGTRRAWIDPTPIAYEVDAHVDFLGDNRDQRFQLLHHTREDGVMSGVTSWGGRDWPVEARMSRNFYVIRSDGSLHWYRHTGRYHLAYAWDAEKLVGSGWNGFKSVIGGGDGVIYAIRPDGKLIWYYHDGRNQGSVAWNGPREVGTGWASARQVFVGDGGVVYLVQADGSLQWYRHIGRRDGTFQWQGPFKVGVGWDGFTALAAGPDGCIYGIKPDGTLLWYRHYGHDQGYPIWHGPLKVGTGWQGYQRLWVAGNGFIYARNAAGELWMWRHHGFQTGEASWTAGVKVGDGWGGAGVLDVVLT
ncbi:MULTISPECIES: tachylectin-related carbohydrate-binding protein [Dyella]|nr:MULTISPECIES: tachylectin-related carbohydrate-binding protein [Dyella]